MTTMAIRNLFLFFLMITGQLASLSERMNYTAIGFSDYVSMLDNGFAKERKLKPLNRFERWLLKPFIETEQKRRRECFRQAFKEITGEDPETDWPLTNSHHREGGVR